MTRRNPESEYGGLVHYWTDGDEIKPPSADPRVWPESTIPPYVSQRGLIRTLGVVVLRVIKPIYRLARPWR